MLFLNTNQNSAKLSNFIIFVWHDLGLQCPLYQGLNCCEDQLTVSLRVCTCILMYTLLKNSTRETMHTQSYVSDIPLSASGN